MCNFMGVRVSQIEYVRLLNVEKREGTLAALRELQSYMDGFKYGNGAIMRMSLDGETEIVKAHWEFIPPWIKSLKDMEEVRKKGIPWLNARSETLLESKMYGPAARKRRCLVIASHFFEWRHYQPEGAKKALTYPYTIGVNEAPYFYIAGIWQPWTDRETGGAIDTFALVTTKANELMSQIHNTKLRMPTILTEELAHEWLQDDLTDDRIREIAAFQIPSEYMYAYPIRKEFKVLEEPCELYDYEELPDLDIAL